MEADLVDASQRALGGTDLVVGPLAFGCWRFTHDSVAAARTVLEAALDAGMTLVDTADVYGLDFAGDGFGANEELLGRVLADGGSGLRERMVLATKGGIRPGVPYDSSAAGLRQACEASLRRLQVDVIDLYQVHRPDLFAHPQEVASTLLALRDDGKIRAFGVSNYTPSQYLALAAHLGEAPATIQPELSAAHLAPLRDGTLDLAMRDGVTPLAWSPLAGGRIPAGDVRPELVAVLDRIATREGVDRNAVAIAFVLAHPSKPVAILGSQQPGRLASATRALDVALDRHDVYEIVQAAEGARLP